MRKPMLFLCLLAALFLAACQGNLPSTQPAIISQNPAAQTTATQVAEAPVTLLSLSGPVSGSNAEISGLAWYGDELVLLPQYPGRFGDAASPGYLYTLPKSAILAFLDGTSTSLPEPGVVPFDSAGLEKSLPGFEGFEALVFRGEQVFMTIETRPGTKMLGYLVRGVASPDLSSIRLDADSLRAIQPQAALSNQSDEALLVWGEQIYSFYEANGVQVNPSPVVHRFDLADQTEGTLPLVPIEYRITDASQPDANGRFWVINYFFPGDQKLKPVSDPLAEKYGKGASHAGSEVVERLVALQIGANQVELADIPPLQLALLADGTARNWEGLAQLDQRGFLLATDKFPETLLAFVALP